jgi:hypothetical protein
VNRLPLSLVQSSGTIHALTCSLNSNLIVAIVTRTYLSTCVVDVPRRMLSARSAVVAIVLATCTQGALSQAAPCRLPSADGFGCVDGYCGVNSGPGPRPLPPVCRTSLELHLGGASIADRVSLARDWCTNRTNCTAFALDPASVVTLAFTATNMTATLQPNVDWTLYVKGGLPPLPPTPPPPTVAPVPPVFPTRCGTDTDCSLNGVCGGGGVSGECKCSVSVRGGPWHGVSRHVHGDPLSIAWHVDPARTRARSLTHACLTYFVADVAW